MTLRILHRTDDWLVIDKPAGVDFHCQNDRAGVIVQLSQQLDCKIWPVHRLDKVTSGCLLVATNAVTAADLSQQFAARQVQKEYLALAQGKPKKKQGWIKGDMTKSRNGSWKLLRSQNNPAITQFHSELVDEPALRSAIWPTANDTSATTYDSPKQSENNLRMYRLFPKTGKTHQLRVMMKSLGVPIIGDDRYGGPHASRCYLHAYRLTFQWNAETISLCSTPNDHGWSKLSVTPN